MLQDFMILCVMLACMALMAWIGLWDWAAPHLEKRRQARGVFLHKPPKMKPVLDRYKESMMQLNYEEKMAKDKLTQEKSE